MEKLVHFTIFDPRNAFFKSMKNDRAECNYTYCSLDECPLRSMGFCACVGILPDECPYGKRHRDEGPTKRSKGLSKWVQDKKAFGGGDAAPHLKFPPHRMALIGDYVYLPYSHMDSNVNVKFLSHSHLFKTGDPFVRKEDWNIDTVIDIIKYSPQALMGGEITSYQKEVVPRFIQHLKEVDPGMHKELLLKMPKLDVPSNYVGRKALLRTLSHPIELKPKNEKYPVAWGWDGSQVTTTSMSAYNGTWGDIKLKEIKVIGTPEDDAVAVVQDNSWVLPETVFID